MLRKMTGYIRVPVNLEDQPEVLKIVSKATRTIYINRAAREGANLIVLLAENPQVLKRPVR